MRIWYSLFVDKKTNSHFTRLPNTMSEELGNNNADQSVSDGPNELTLSVKCQHELGVCIGREDYPICSSPMSAREAYSGLDWCGGDAGVVAISANGKIGASSVERESDEEGEIIRIWNVATGKSIRDLKGIEGEVDSLAMSAYGERVVAGLYVENKVRVWDISTGECVCDVDSVISDRCSPCFCASFSQIDCDVRRSMPTRSRVTSSTL